MEGEPGGPREVEEKPTPWRLRLVPIPEGLGNSGNMKFVLLLHFYQLPDTAVWSYERDGEEIIRWLSGVQERSGGGYVVQYPALQGVEKERK